MAHIDKEKAIQEILELFEYQLSLLAWMDKLKKMEIRQRIRDVIQPTIRMDLRQPKVFMEIIEDKLESVIDFFCDGEEFKKNWPEK